MVKEGYEYDHLYDWVMINNQHVGENIFSVESFDELKVNNDKEKMIKTESIEGNKDNDEKEEGEEEEDKDLEDDEQSPDKDSPKRNDDDKDP